MEVKSNVGYLVTEMVVSGWALAGLLLTCYNTTVAAFILLGVAFLLGINKAAGIAFLAVLVGGSLSLCRCTRLTPRLTQSSSHARLSWLSG